MKQTANSTSISKSIEKFINSDSAPATAGKFLLMTLSLGGIVVSGAIAPGLFHLFKNERYSRKYSKNQLRNSFYNLKRNKLIKIVGVKGDNFKIELTNTGQKRVREFYFAKLAIQKPAKWDGKWRVFIFDIPTRPKIYNQAREALRKKIKELGFYQMQKSVWVYPYECTDEILFVAELFYVQKYIEILTVEKLLHEDRIKKVFSL